MMRIVFMGTPDFAVPSLAALHENGYDVSLVVTQPDKPQGRHKIMTASPVKEYAVARHIPVFQPDTLKTDEAYSRIAGEKPDCIVVAAYGKILPQRVLDIPEYGCVNVHGSLLPKYRGAAPIQWSVINGDHETGVTTMLMDAGLDTGAILLQKKTEIGEKETAGELFDRLAVFSAPVLLETLEKLQAGMLTPIRQNEDDATYVSVLKKEKASIDWTQPASVIYNQIRGMNPWPVAWTVLDGKILKIFVASVLCESGCTLAPGRAEEKKAGLQVGCGNGSALLVTRLQYEGGKQMSASDFIRGRKSDGEIRLG